MQWKTRFRTAGFWESNRGTTLLVISDNLFSILTLPAVSFNFLSFSEPPNISSTHAALLPLALFVHLNRACAAANCELIFVFLSVSPTFLAVRAHNPMVPR